MLFRLLWRGTTALLFLLAGGPTSGQQYAFRQFTSQNGLAQSQVRTMAQDANGYLWFGTLGGASRFDGQYFHNLTLQDGLPDAQVSAMLRTRDGRFWMGAGNSLVQVVGRELHNAPLPPESKGARILGLAETTDGSLYIGTDGGGLFVRGPDGIRSAPGYPTDTAGNVRCVLALRDGSLLVGLRNGLLHGRNGSFASVRLGDGEPKLVSALAEGKDGNWWVGTLGTGLYQLKPDGTQQEYDEEYGLLQDHIRSLLVDDSGRLWVCTKLGVNVLDGARTRLFTVHQGMPNDNILCSYQDDEGNIWLGTDGAGAIRYLGDRFVTFTMKDGVCSDLVMSMTADAQGDVWLGTYDNGVCRMDGMAMITTTDGLPNNTVWSGTLARDGTLWFGTSEGLAHVKNGVVVPLPDSSALIGQRIFALHEDEEGALWCGTRDGLTILDSIGRSRALPNGPDGVGRSVRSIVPDGEGGVWLGSDNGLSHWSQGNLERYTVQDGLPDNTVLCIVVDGAKRPWVGTSNGAACLIGGRLRTVRFASDFGSNYFDLLRCDANGRIWAGTNNGLYLFHPDSLLADSTRFEHITRSEGLRNVEFNLNASYALPNGKLLFGTAGGTVLHDTKRPLPRTEPPPPRVHLLAVRSFLQHTDWKGKCDSLTVEGLPAGLHLDHRRHYLTFDYSAVSLSKPEHVRYRYRLVGYDPDWLPATEARFASYSNLPHGDFTFEVSASTDGSRWGSPAAFHFRIDPPFWSRWWFYLLCVAATALILFGIQRYRSVRRERRERTRQLMLRSRMLQLEQQALNANMNRHFVFNALNSIQFHINRQDRATASRYLTSFAKLIRKNLDASQNDTTTLAEELERLELYLRLEHMRFKDKFRYSIHVDPAVDINHIRLPAMMLQPYVENSIWHGILPMEQQGHVQISAYPASEADRVVVKIEDDGIGVDQSLKAKQEQEGDHISRGIEITKGRADVLRKLDINDIRIKGPEQWTDPNTNRIMGTRVFIELSVDLPSKFQGESLR